MAVVVMTGATGFLGKYVAWELVERGHQVFNVESASADRSLLEQDPRGARVASLKYKNEYEGLSSDVRDVRPDVLIHLAARPGKGETGEQIRAMFEPALVLPSIISRAMLDCNKQPGVILCGTSWQNADNSSEYVPFDFYSATKQAAEDLIKAHVRLGAKALFLRLYDTYGPFDKRKKIVDLLFNSAIRQEPIDMSPGFQKIDLVYVQDAAQAFAKAVDYIETMPQGQTQTYAVCSKSYISLRELAEKVGNLVGHPPQVNWGGRSYRDGEIMQPYGGIPFLPAWQPQTGLQQGLRIVFDAYKRDE